MHLKRIELTNYRQHKELDVDFSGNLIAVLGGNGSGKSNFLGAIQFALTGEQPPFKKEDLTKWGEETGSVRLYFTAGSSNKEMCITRKTNGDAVLEIEGEKEKVKGARKVADMLAALAGLDKELLRQVVFVPQKGIDAILFDDPKAREVAFQKLIGIGEASKIYETLRTEIAAYDRPSAFNEAIAKAREQLAVSEQQLASCQEQIKHFDEVIKALPDKQALQEEAVKAATLQSKVNELVSLRKDLRAAQDENAKTLSDMSAMSYVPPAEGEEDELRAVLSNAATEVAYIKRLAELCGAAKKAHDDYCKARIACDEFAESHGDIESDRSEATETEKLLAIDRAEIRHLESISSEDSANGECPLCGSHVEPGDIAKHVSGRMAELKAEEQRYAPKLRELQERVAKADRESASLNSAANAAKAVKDSTFATLSAAKDKNVEGVEIDLHRFEFSYKGKTMSDVESLERNCAEAKRRLEEIAAGAKANADLVAKANRQSATIEVQKKRELELLRDLAGEGMDVKDADLEEVSRKMFDKADRARTNIRAYDDISNGLAQERGKCATLLSSIDQAKENLADLEEKQKEDDMLQEKVGVLKRAREWFHFREGPRIMSQNVMKDLCGWVNDFLDQFCAPFVVEAEEEGFGFRCRFIDGRAMPDPCPDASMLSGGQKVMLAIAFRMAVYMRFGGELGLLSLDEPTAYLDDAAVEHLGDLLTKVGQIARNRGLQILMATHEKAIMPYLDTQIVIGEKK